MTLTPEQLAAAAIDQMLTLVAASKTQRHPVEWLENQLLDMRLEVTT